MRRLLATDFTFAIIGDYGNNNQAEADVAAMVHGWHPSFIATTGDNNWPVGAADTVDPNIGQFYHDYIYPYKGSYAAGSADGVNHFFATLGNHDYYTDNGQVEVNYLSAPTGPGNGRYFDYMQGNVELFVLDDNPGTPDGYTATSVQAQWLQRELSASPAAYKLVFFHEPAYTSGVSGGDPSMRWPYKDWGATAVFSGHDHVYERLSVGGLPYITDGLGGDDISHFDGIYPDSVVRYNGDHGAILAHVTGTSLELKFISVGGVVVDDFVIPNPAPQTAPTAPTGFTATTVSSGQVNLSWTNTSNTAGAIRIERSSTAGALTQILVSPTATSYADRGVSQLTQYTYRICATNAGGDSPYSIASATTPAGVSGTLIARNAVWSYLDNGTNQGTAWRAINFDDSAWKTGPAELGYGDGDEATVVGYGPDSNNKYITTYFRKSFMLSDPSTVQALGLNIVRDDGAVVYLNGTEVFRTNMDSGSVSYTTLASTGIGLPQEATWYPATIPISGLVAGKNVIAVEVHQAGPDSSDISFNFELLPTLVAFLPAAPSNLAASAVSGSEIDLTWSDNSGDETGFKMDRASDPAFTQNLVTTSIAANATSYHATSLTGGLYYFRVRSSNGVGDSANSASAAAGVWGGAAGPDNLRVRLDSGHNVQFYDDNIDPLTPRFTVDRASLGSLYVSGAAGNDKLTVDFAGGDPLPAGGLTFDGGAGSNTLTVAGASGSDCFTLGAGQITHGGNVLAYANVGTLAVSSGVMLANGLSGASAVGTIDLATNSLLDRGDSLGTWTGSGYSGLTGVVARGYAAGNWGGTGVTSSAAVADAMRNHGVGVLSRDEAAANGNAGIVAAGGFHGQTAGPTDLLVQYGWNGDVNMDGAISYLDYGVIDNAYLYNQLHPSTPKRGYGNGDLNFDGTINYLDYGMIDNAGLAINAPHVATTMADAEVVLPPSATPFATQTIAQRVADDVLGSASSPVTA